MTTSTLEVGDLLSALDAHGIEKQLKRISGVGRVWVNMTLEALQRAASVLVRLIRLELV